MAARLGASLAVRRPKAMATGPKSGTTKKSAKPKTQRGKEAFMSDKTQILNGRAITRAVDDAVAYPILTRDMTSQTSDTPAPSTGSAAGGSSVTDVAKKTLRQILGWRVNPADIAGFTAALTRAYQLTEVEGHIEATLEQVTPSQPAEAGQISGPQAIVYNTALVTITQALGIIPQLKPLKPSPDYSKIDAVRELVVGELNQLLTILRAPGGILMQRADLLFLRLLGPIINKKRDKLQGHLGQLNQRLGMDPTYIDTMDDEDVYTKSQTVVSYVESVYNLYKEHHKELAEGANDYLSNAITLVAQAMESLTSAVQSASDAMASVYVGPQEQLTCFLSFWRESELSVADLFGWIQEITQQQLDSKDAAIAYHTTVNSLHYLVKLACIRFRSGTGDLPSGCYSVRNIRAWEEVWSNARLLSRELKDLSVASLDEDPALAVEQFKLPEVSKMTMDSKKQTLTIHGSNLTSETIVRMISVRNPSIGCDFTVSNKTKHPTAWQEKLDPNSRPDELTAAKFLTDVGDGGELLIVALNPDGLRTYRQATLKAKKNGKGTRIISYAVTWKDDWGDGQTGIAN